MSNQLQQMQAELEALKVENAALKASSAGPITLKVGPKGGISAYGLQRNPVTLYYSQWIRLLTYMADHFEAFVASKPTRTLDDGTVVSLKLERD